MQFIPNIRIVIKSLDTGVTLFPRIFWQEHHPFYNRYTSTSITLTL